MPERWEDRFAELSKEECGLMDIYFGIRDDFMMDHPEVPIRYVQMLVRGAINRSYVTNAIRSEMETYYKTGHWRKRSEE